MKQSISLCCFLIIKTASFAIYKGGQTTKHQNSIKVSRSTLRAAHARNKVHFFQDRVPTSKNGYTPPFSAVLRRAAASMKNARKPSRTNGFGAFPNPLQNRVPGRVAERPQCGKQRGIKLSAAVENIEETVRSTRRCFRVTANGR